MEALPGGRLDRLSRLPDDILQQILSSLPTTEAVLTSLLSRRWRHLWRFLPCLDFDYGSFHQARRSWRCGFSEFVGHVMSTRDPAVAVQRFRLHWPRRDEDATRLAPSWVEGLHGDLRDLDLHLHSFEGFRLERVLHSAPSLEVLRLETNMDHHHHHHKHLVFQDPPRPLRRLRTLSLAGFESEDGDDAWLERLVAMCPALEELALFRFSCGRRLRLVAPKLVRLTAFDPQGRGSLIQVEAPHLRHVNGLPWQEKPWLLEGRINLLAALDVTDLMDLWPLASSGAEPFCAALGELIQILSVLDRTGPQIRR